MMKHILASEQIMQLALAIGALYFQPIHITWWIWLFLFLSPDISMLGYLAGSRVGAICYNIAHHKAVAGLFVIAGFLAHGPVLMFIGLLLWAHSAFDRIMGYGLKYPDSFGHTHLGFVGKEKLVQKP